MTKKYKIIGNTSGDDLPFHFFEIGDVVTMVEDGKVYEDEGHPVADFLGPTMLAQYVRMMDVEEIV
ncbi:MAG: hypothetical protein ACXW1D_00125 [Halobacteriota archaeon]